ncbi:MAG: polysaccharide pyruvyl transferase family protein [Phycisphaeraceae bacterium]|nr:polysaccharide pyruvyl transferase family protein [Phycisphaeraceae bacterium]
MVTHRHNKPYRIAYIGWLGHDNIGDELGPEVFRRCFAEEAPDLSAQCELVTQRERWPECEASVVGLGTLISPGDYRTEWMREFRLASLRGPLVGLGLGVVPPPTWERWPVAPSRKYRVRDWFDYLCLRGKMSAQMLGAPESIISGDTVFGIRWTAPRPSPNRRRPLLMVNLGEGRHPLMIRPGQSLCAAVAQACRQLESRFEIAFFSMGRRDDEPIREAASLLTTPPRIVTERDPFTLAQILAEADLGLTVKCHASGLLYAVGVPTVNVAYRSKCADLAGEVTDDRYVVAAAEAETAHLVEKVDALASERAAVRTDLQNATDRALHRYRSHFRLAMEPIRAGVEGHYQNSARSVMLRDRVGALLAYPHAVTARAARWIDNRRKRTGHEI